jgi:phosphonate transport system substrate-binding protein
MTILRGLGNKLPLAAAVLLLPQLACAGSLKVGSVNTSPVAETRKFSAFTSYLARQLQSEGIDGDKVVVADNIPGMSSLLQAQQVDLYIDSFFPSMAVSRLSGSKFLLRRWKGGKSEYQSVIFTRKDSAVARLEDLKGKLIAFEEPFASTGYFFPKVVLLEKGFRLTPKRQGIDAVKADEVGYVFSRGDSNTILLVLNGATTAGVTDDQKYLMLAKNLDSFKIIHETASFPRQFVSYRADLPATLVAKIKEILLNMHQTDEGKQVLKAFESTTKFEEIPVRDMELAAGLRKHVDAELKLNR